MADIHSKPKNETGAQLLSLLNVTTNGLVPRTAHTKTPTVCRSCDFRFSVHASSSSVLVLTLKVTMINTAKMVTQCIVHTPINARYLVLAVIEDGKNGTTREVVSAGKLFLYSADIVLHVLH